LGDCTQKNTFFPNKHSKLPTASPAQLLT
jgi:hypothetical protein